MTQANDARNAASGIAIAIGVTIADGLAKTDGDAFLRALRTNIAWVHNDSRSFDRYDLATMNHIYDEIAQHTRAARNKRRP